MAVAADPRTQEEQSRGQRVVRWLLTRSSVFWVTVFLVLTIVIFAVLTEGVFLRFTNFRSMATNASVLIIVAVGMTYLLGAGELDLSVGTNIVVCQIVAARLIVDLAGTTEQVSQRIYPNLTIALIVGFSAAIVVGTLIGIVNGLLVTKLHVNSFIVTLGMFGVLQGAALGLTGGINIQYIPRQLQSEFAALELFDVIPAMVIIMAVVAISGGIVLKRTRYGLRTVALGSDRQAALRAGLRQDRHIISLFALVGFCCGLAGLLDVARFAATNLGGHAFTALDAITAVVLGGTSLFGGAATILGTVIGAFIPITLQTGLIIEATRPGWQFAVTGELLIVAVALDQVRRQRNL